MKINEIIVEHKTTELNKHHDAAHPGAIYRTRDVGGYDRVYHLNRMGMALAMADGKSTNAVDSPADTWFEKYNTIHPYTEEENKMVKSAMKTVPTDGRLVSNDRKSREQDDTHKVSPVQDRGSIKRKS